MPTDPSIETLRIREAAAGDLDGIARIYGTLWCNTLRNRGDIEDAELAARFNVAMQLQDSPIALVAESDGEVIAACMVGVFDDGAPRPNPAWQQAYDELLAQATSRRFAATGNPYAQGQVNLIIIDPAWQGRGLGRRLIDAARGHLRDLGCSAFFLMTDNQSDYAFYDHIGMERIAEDHSQDTGDGFTVYIYGDAC